MSLTVVVTRDYDDVPNCFEKYELGTRWRVNGGNLEVFVGTTLVALYPSGNWISVFVDDAMQLLKDGALPDYSTMPRVGGSPATPAVEVGDEVGDEDGDEVGDEDGHEPTGDPEPALAADELPPDDPTADDPEPTADDVSEWHISRSRPNAPVEDPMYGPGGLFEQYDGGSGSSSPDIIAGEDVAAARAAMVPVSFRPRTYRTPAPAKKSPTGPRLLPIKLRMKRFRQSGTGEPPAESTGPRMLPVQMRTTTYRAARQRPEPPPEGRDSSTPGDDERAD